MAVNVGMALSEALRVAPAPYSVDAAWRQSAAVLAAIQPGASNRQPNHAARMPASVLGQRLVP